jgi:hypothetical protein
MEFKIGQILNCAYGDTLFAKLIRFRNKFYYGSPYTHTSIITFVGEDYLTIAEALGDGFTISNYEKWWVEGRIKDGTITLGNSIVPLINVKENAEKYKGTEYGFLGIFYIALSFLGHKSINWSDGTKSLICSEAVARILYDSSNKQIDFVKEFGKSYDTITPDDFSKSKQIIWENNNGS